MNRVLCLLCLGFLVSGVPLRSAEPKRVPATPEREKQHYTLYAQVMGNVEVRLANGMPWLVKKHDVFPVMMFKEQQTIAVLQLAGTTFRLSTDPWLKMIESKDLTEEQVANYRATVQVFLDKVADDARANLPGAK
jgi:hypothetical protein